MALTLGSLLGTARPTVKSVPDAELQAALNRDRYNTMVNSINALGRTTSYAPEPAEDISSPAWRKRILGMRLRISEGHKYPFDALETHWAGEKVFLFVVVDAKPVVLEDESALFPSDALITQLRLIQK
jgi:hypothetical protein